MELLTRSARQVIRLAYEILKKVPRDCPSKAVAVGASVLLVLASLVVARMAITTIDETRRVREEDLCGQCEMRTTCKVSRAR
ncbi:MAG: hypothetical protein HW403_437 [Dehalococcoidia bacterium]|nr:hypothetical protein [Dehalococcoidia bacterium]